jgi:hypothetical protein
MDYIRIVHMLAIGRLVLLAEFSTGLALLIIISFMPGLWYWFRFTDTGLDILPSL